MEWASLANGLERRDSQVLNQSNDPRIGSSRDNSTTGTLSHVTSSGTDSASASSLGSTFVPVLIYASICLSIFFVFRRRSRRVYAPRTLPGIRRPPLEPVPPLPDTWFSWIKDFHRIDDKFVLNNCSLDGFLFLRYLRVLATICFAGCAISWPVLLSVNATGGNGLIQLDLLTIGNVARPLKFYAHVLISWVLFGFILFMICRECVFYINLRQAYLMAPQHAQRLSARTVLFTCVPKRFLDERRIRKLFGDAVKNVWIPRDTKPLLRLVDERDKAAVRLEKAEIELIKKANRARNRMHATTSLLPLPVSSMPPAAASPTRSTTSSSLASSASASSSSSSSSSPPSSPSSSSPSSSSLSHRSSTSSSAVASAASPSAASAASAAFTAPAGAPDATPSSPSPSSPSPSSTAYSPFSPSSASSPPPPASDRRASDGSKASAAERAAAPPPATMAASPSPIQRILPAGMVHRFRHLADVLEPAKAVVKGKGHEKPTSADGRGPLSNDTYSAPTPSATGLGLVNGPSMDDKEAGTQLDTKNIVVASAAAGYEEEENEMDYVHPYGFASTLPDVRGSVAAQWLPASARPTHRPLSNFGRKVDTIRWTRMRIKSLNKAIARMRRRYRAGDGTPLSSLFVEFDSQAAAQVAYQVLAHHQPLHMSPRFIGIRPEDVIWSSLRMRWWERIIRRFLVLGAVAAGIVFWSVPAAFVGIVSNVSFLSEKVFFLHWIGDLPSVITGVIEGLLPAVALSLLMAAVPGMLRVCARAAGVPSAPMVELFTQHAYFCFQVVQVFLVTTLTSAASAAFSQILQDPLSAKDLLSQNLPKSSNFYLSYITVQCLAGGAIGLVHFVDLFRHTLLARTIQHPRRAVRNFQRLKQPHWGGVFPVYTNMGVIAISYTCIAPLILAFAGVGLCCTYQVYKYNLLYYYNSDCDSKGLHYPRALMHLMFGLYLAEICLIGLFSIQAAVGPVVMMVMFLVFTFLVHISLNDAVQPLLSSLPRTLALDDKDLAAGHQDKLQAEQEAATAAAAAASAGAGASSGAGLNADYYDMEEGFGDEHDSDDDLHAGPVSTRGGIDGAGDLVNLVKDWGRDALKHKVKAEVKALSKDVRSFSLTERLPWGRKKQQQQQQQQQQRGGEAGELGPDGQPVAAAVKRPNFFIRWLHPELYEDYTFLRTLLPVDVPPVEYPPDYVRRGYWPPEMWRPIPKLWIPRDDARVSRQEVAHTRAVLPITDRGAWLTRKGNVVADLDRAPFLEPIYLY